MRRRVRRRAWRSRSCAPLKDLQLRIEQDGRSWDLGVTDVSNSDYRVRWDVTLPADLTAGEIAFVVAPAGPVDVMLVTH